MLAAFVFGSGVEMRDASFPNLPLVSLAFSLPVLALSYYDILLVVSARRYRRSLGIVSRPKLISQPAVSILIATCNEENVIGATLDSINDVKYPTEKVIIADDSNDESAPLIADEVAELPGAGIVAFVSRRSTRAGFEAAALEREPQKTAFR
jgi:hypothetical protein